MQPAEAKAIFADVGGKIMPWVRGWRKPKLN